MNLIEDIAAYLAQNDMGQVGKTIFLSSLPDYEGMPADVIALHEYAGSPVSSLDSDFAALSLQATVRGNDYSTALKRAYQISTLLKDVGNTMKGKEPLRIGNTLYLRITANQNPYKLREDEQNHIYFVQNFKVWARKLEDL